MNGRGGEGHYVVPLILALPLQDGGGVKRRGGCQMLRGRHELVSAGSREERGHDVVHHGGEWQPPETAMAAIGLSPHYRRGSEGLAVALRKRKAVWGMAVGLSPQARERPKRLAQSHYLDFFILIYIFF
jgi:hypothetical protein